MKPDFEKVSKCVIKQNEHIKIFNETTPEQLFLYLFEEMDELRDVLEKDDFDPIELESEISDVFYLLIRLANHCGVDLMEGVLSKVARNHKKYRPFETRAEAKANWSHEKDHEFLSEWVKQYRIKQAKVDKLSQTK